MTSNALAIPQVQGADGLEDLDERDLTIPRLRIEHKLGVFKDGQTGQEFDHVYAIMLGLVKQRILWHPTVEKDDKPMCKSPDFVNGYPNLLAPAKKSFPWDKAMLDANDFPAGDDGVKSVPCEGCKLKEWGSHPLGDKPYCSEQHTLPMLYAPTLEELKNGEFSPALFTVQKSGLKPSKNYLSPFKQRKRPVYSVITRINLLSLSTGTNPYAIPKFSQVEETDQNDWIEFSERLAAMQEFLRGSRPRGAAGEDGATSVSQPPVQSGTATERYIQPNSPTVAQVGAEAGIPPEDDLPF